MIKKGILHFQQIEDLEFQVRPLSIVFQGNAYERFVLYLEKGLQILGRFDSGVRAFPKSSLHRFMGEQKAKFRLHMPILSIYHWSLYKVNKDEQEQLVENSDFSLKSYIDEYQKQLSQKQKEMAGILKDKNVTYAKLYENWGRLKLTFFSNKSIIKSMFNQKQIHLEFALQIKNRWDQEYQRIKSQMDEKGNLRRVKSDLKLNSIDQSFDISTDKLNTSLPLIKIDQVQSPGKSQVDNEQFDGTKVIIVNPLGQKMLQNQKDEDIVKKSHSTEKNTQAYYLLQPQKKFSALSDIVEQSHEGSSSFGTMEKDRINSIPRIEQDKGTSLIPKRQNELFLKNRTLQQDIEHKQQLRRVFTTGRNTKAQQILGEQLQEELDEFQPQQKYVHSKSNNEKSYKLVIILFIIVIIIGIQWMIYFRYSDDQSNLKQKRKNRKKKSRF